MGHSQISSRPMELLDEVVEFVSKSSGLSISVGAEGAVTVRQLIDKKTFSFKQIDLEEILQRTDADGKKFIQVNLRSGLKILLTETLVGFKPIEISGLDMTKIPRVVTTPDLLSVFEAIEESLDSDASHDNEVEILKRVFQSILAGGELAGFDLEVEKRWLARLVPSKMKASA